MIIYRITNLINKKVYIGQTVQLIRKRWARHICNARKKINKPLYNAINKYGKENFIIEEIEKCQFYNQLNERERFWINFYKSTQINFGYNITDGGNQGRCPQEVYDRIGLKRRGVHLSEKTKKLISESNKGKIFSKETRQKLSIAATNKIVSEATKLKLSIFHKGNSFFKGKHHSKETKLKLSKTRLGKTYEEIMGIEKAKIVKEKKKGKFLGEKSPVYKNIDKEKLLEFMKLGYDNKYIANIFRTTNPTIISRVKKYFNKTPTEMRMEFFNSPNPLTKKKEYKKIDLNNVINLIKLNKDRKTICQEIKISGSILNKRLIKNYGIKFGVFRKKILEGKIYESKS
jgi:group I intron endonuclease